MLKTIAVLLLLNIAPLTPQNQRSLVLSSMNDVQYQCLDPACSSSTIINAANMRRCQLACISDPNCRTMTFIPSNHRCELFPDIPSQFGHMVAATGVVTMLATDDRQLSARK